MKDIDKILEISLENNWNVLLKGLHGTGKTARVVNLFNKSGLKWVYFSASTMDPWVDFIGIPHKEEENGISYLGLVRPKRFATDEVEAIFIDEYNRAKPAIKNATMQLIQFKSINDHKFNNLRVVWAAINPDDNDEQLQYEVEKIDPAQKDRFHIHIDIPYLPDFNYFSNKFDKHIAESAIEWWKKLNSTNKLSISPRRLEYALDAYMKLISDDVCLDIIKNILPKESNPTELIRLIKLGSYKDRLSILLKEKDKKKLKTFLDDFNNLQGILPYVFKSTLLADEILPYVDRETLASLLMHDKYGSNVASFLIKNKDNYKDLIESVIINNKDNLNNQAYMSLFNNNKDIKK